MKSNTLKTPIPTVLLFPPFSSQTVSSLIQHFTRPIGQLSRRCHTRYWQEREENNQEKKGFMFKHAEKCHERDFVVRRECLNQVHRVVMEGLRIEKAMKDPTTVIKNSRKEHYGPQVVRSRFGTDWMMMK